MTSSTMRRAALGLALAGTMAGAAATGAAAPSTMPAANPTDARAAELVTFQKAVPAAKLGGNANSYFYASNGGGQVKIGKTTARGFTAFQTVTVTPPSGTTILQGFATISGGNTGSRLIRSTSTAPAAYTIRLSEPGEQGTPGKLTFRIQVVPKPG
jgi:hypothetical protein